MGTPINQVMYPSAERSRKLQQISFEPNRILSRDLPRDTVLKALQLRLSGSVQTTYASGTPVSDAQSIFDNLVPRIDVIVDGSRVIKSVRPHLLRMQQLFTTTIAGERRASAAGAPAPGNLPTTDGGFVFGTTTQFTTVAESIYLPFEMVYAEPGFGRESTYLNLKGRASAEIRLTTAAFAALQGAGNTAPVTYGTSTLAVDIYTIEAQEVDARIQFADWKQTSKVVQFSGQTNGFAIELSRGNKLSGVMLFAQDGAAGSTTTATGRMPSNLLVTDIALQLNGQTTIKSVDFKALQAQNRLMYGVNAPLSAGASLIDGVAHLNLLARKDLSTALSVEAPAVDNLQLLVSTESASVVSYATPAQLTVQTEEIVYPRQ